MTALPTFWIPFVLISVFCIVIALREDMVHGPQLRGHEEQWTPRYRFCIEYAGRIIIVGGLCAVMQAVLWIVGAFV